MLEQAAGALRAQHFAQAEQLAERVLKANRGDIAATAILAQALLAQNRAADAVTSLEKTARRKSDPGLETLLGAALGRAGRRDEAVTQLRETTTRRPPFVPAFQELAGLLATAGRGGEAIAVIESALALLPQLVDLKLDLARLHVQCNSRDKARTLLLAAREAAPGRRDILIELGRILILDGDYAAAADAFRHALALQPNDAMTRADLAACLLEMGDRNLGEGTLRAAAQGRPQMLGRVTHALAASSHGRFFLRPSAMQKFLRDDGGPSN